MGDIGGNPREYEFEPLEAPAVPEPAYAPSQPEPSTPTPEREPAYGLRIGYELPPLSSSSRKDYVNV